MATGLGWGVERLTRWQVPEELRGVPEPVPFVESLLGPSIAAAFGLRLLGPSDDGLARLPERLRRRRVWLTTLRAARGLTAPAFMTPANDTWPLRSRRRSSMNLFAKIAARRPFPSPQRGAARKQPALHRTHHEEKKDMGDSLIRRKVFAILLAALASTGSGWLLHGTAGSLPTAVAQSEGSYYVWITCPGFKRQQIWGPYSYDHAWSVVRQASEKGCQARVSTDDGSPRRLPRPVPPQGGHR